MEGRKEERREGGRKGGMVRESICEQMDWRNCMHPRKCGNKAGKLNGVKMEW